MNLADRTVAKAFLIIEAEKIIDDMVANDKDYIDIIATITLLIGDKVNTTDKISILDISARYYRKVQDRQ